MKFEEVLPLLRAGRVARLPHWHETMGIIVTEGRFEWVEPAWKGYESSGEGAHMDHASLLSEEWVVIE